MTDIEEAVDYCAGEIRAGRPCTGADLTRIFGVSSGEACRRVAEDITARDNPVAKPAIKTTPNSTTGKAANYKHSAHYRAEMAKLQVDGFARSLPRVK